MYKKVTTIEEYSDAPPFNGGPAMQNSAKKYAPCIRVDVPLLIRLLEFAREDASSDLDLHALASRMISESEGGKVLTMEDYEELIEGLPVVQKSSK